MAKMAAADARGATIDLRVYHLAVTDMVNGRDIYLTSTPGDNLKFEVTLISPIAMEEKLRFAIREGGRTVGAGVVSKILK